MQKVRLLNLIRAERLRACAMSVAVRDETLRAGHREVAEALCIAEMICWKYYHPEVTADEAGR